ncbi:MAG: M50 family metallopeptidase [Opitutales bacterium]|nr:M50 family metallopeptidase [Opitutales bacterium]
MGEDRKLFSESWHRVAPQKIRLRPSVKVRKQYFRGQCWFVANDAYSDQYFRFRPEAWAFIRRLDGTQTVEEIWQSTLDREGDQAPGQGEVIQMLANLYQSNLVVSDFPADVAQLFERQKKRHAREWKSRLFGIFFLRIPLWDPDNFLNRTFPYVKWLVNPLGALLWLALVGGGLAVVVANWEELFARGQGVLAPGNLPLLLLAFVIAKVIHEFGHGYAVKRFGGEVHTMGITFLVFTPIPYVDASAAWAFRERWKRIWVGASGMIVELAIAAIAAFVWAATGPGLLNAWCFNLMVVASVSTILFNINPLLKFDGYYILSDLTDTPNLQPRSFKQIGHVVEKYGFGGKHSEKPSNGLGEAIWLFFFGVASWTFRLYITFVIIMFVADRYLGLGFIAAVLTIIGLFVIPATKGIKFLFTEPRIERVRNRAFAVTAGFIGLVFLLLGVIPAPRYFHAHGVLFAEDAVFLVARTDGEVVLHQGHLSEVEAGDLLIRLENPELGMTRRQLEAETALLEAMSRRLLAAEGIGREVWQQRYDANVMRLLELSEREQAVEIRAPRSGLLAAGQADDQLGRRVNRGMILGEVVSEGSWHFFAVVGQRNANLLFEEGLRNPRIRFYGSSGNEVIPESVHIVPGQQERLPSPALGWASQGPIEVREDDGQGVRAVEPFFLVRMDLEGEGAPLHHGRTGRVRFQVNPEPYLHQWYRKLRQMVQDRFQL